MTTNSEKTERIPLRAGPLSMIFENGDLRYIRLGEKMLILRIYSAARDRRWGTAPAILSDLQMQIEDDHFAIRYTCENRYDDIDFIWQGAMDGAADGTLRFSMDGVARASFMRNRLGFCVLHPMQLAGDVARVTHVDGSVEETTFPRLIEPQRVIDGALQPMPVFNEMRAVSQLVRPGVWAHIEFEGDIFETEDQRNWTDASYKTYCTPLRLPYPVEVKVGTRVAQAINLRLEGAAASAQPKRRAAKSATPVTVRVGRKTTALPALGLGVATNEPPLKGKQLAALKALKLSHLRVDLALWAEEWPARLKQAAKEAKALGAGLELGIFVSAAADAELRAFVAQAKLAKLPVLRYLVFHRDEAATSPATIALARQHLGPQATIYSGTNLFFTELNCHRPSRDDLKQVNGLCYSFNPQVHAFDDSSIVETLATQAETVQTYAAFAGRTPLAIGPITLAQRFDLARVGPEPTAAPLKNDYRQATTLGASWTLGSLKYIAQTGAVNSATYYQTTGLRGVMDVRIAFPLYHVFADVAEFEGGEVVASQSSEPLRVESLVLRKGKRTRVLLGNFSDQPTTVNLSKLGARATVKFLMNDTPAVALNKLDSDRAERGTRMNTTQGKLSLTLPPYALARVDG